MNHLLESLLLGCAGVMAAWLSRLPLRRVTGPGPAFGAWVLVPLLAALPWLPPWPPMMRVTAGFIPTFTPIVVTASPTDAAIPAWFWLWSAGTAALLTRIVGGHARIMRQSLPLPTALRRTLANQLTTRQLSRLRLHAAGPAVIWGLPGRVLVPADFASRHDAVARALVLKHEFTHLRRADPWWSLLAELTLAALWFFPPAWLARGRFRLDLELACDAAVLRQAPACAGNYARTLVGSLPLGRHRATLSPWLSHPQLKERLIMIQQRNMRHLRRLPASLTLVAVLGTASLGAQATLARPGVSPAASTTATDRPTTNVSFRDRHPPRYPPDAVAHHQQGTVVVDVLIDTDGRPLKTRVATSSGVASLDDAAVAATRNWRFQPGMRDGQPYKGWARIPVEFSIPDTPVAEQDTTTPAPAATTASRSLRIRTSRP